MHERSLDIITMNKKILLKSLAWQRYQALRTLHNTRARYQTHYELLGLKKDCTATEIRDSFLRLSKELHPDKNPGSPEVHKKFIALNEAHSVLSRPHLRSIYDAELLNKDRQFTYTTHAGIRTNAPREKVVFRDDTIWEMRDKSEDHRYEGQPYYGVKGINKKLPNSYIAAGAVMFMIIGALFHFYLAKVSSDFAIEQLNRRDQIASQNHMMARERAKLNGNELQLALLRQKLENGNNNK